MSDCGACSLIEPDCVKCLRKKLQAIGIVVFFEDEAGWHIGNFQGDKPLHEAEVDFEIMLNAKAPEAVLSYGQGLLISNNDTLAEILPSLKYLLEDSSVIAAPVAYKELKGVRLAWREGTNPFTQEDLTMMQCFGACPEGCI